MKNTGRILVLALIVSLSAGVVLAWGPHHDGMDEIFEEGTYEDLMEYREDLGWNVMPWIDSEEDFEYAHERHEARGPGHMRGYGRSAGRAGCPMWQ